MRHCVGPLRGAPAGDGLALGGGGPGPAPGGPAQSGGVAPKDVARVAVVRRQGAVHVPRNNLNSNNKLCFYRYFLRGNKIVCPILILNNNYIPTFYGKIRLRVSFEFKYVIQGLFFFITGESHLPSAEVCDLDESVLDRPRVLALDLCEQIINEFC